MRTLTPYEELAYYMDRRHPRSPYVFSLAGFRVPERVTARLGTSRAVANDRTAASMTYDGLILTYKPVGTRLRKRDGNWSSDRIAAQAARLEEWAQMGYIAQFACGIDEATQMIDSYLSGGQPL